VRSVHLHLVHQLVELVIQLHQGHLHLCMCTRLSFGKKRGRWWWWEGREDFLLVGLPEFMFLNLGREGGQACISIWSTSL
jgi:hypothetical protein